MKRKIYTKLIAFTLLVIIILAIIPFGENEPIKYINRESGETRIEKVAGEAWLRWLYNNPIGEVSMFTLVKRKFISDWYGKRMDAPASKEKIAPFVKDYNVDLSIAQKQDFASFNDFFYRKLKQEKRPVHQDSNTIVSPADGKILAYENIENEDFIVKGYKFNVKEFFQNDDIYKKYTDGSLMIIRLCPTDYHRYHFPVSGTIIQDKIIEGDYYSVSPIALKKKIELITLNKRSCCEIETEKFGRVVFSEVAATMVGSMVNTYEDAQVLKGEEKGYFKFGGSTIILFFEKGKIKIDKDLLENTSRGIETEIIMGEAIAKQF